jgi:F0F1-type ATP synthase delta subunit
MNNQIQIMEEMVQRTEANLQQMQALLAEAKATQVSSMTLTDEVIRRIAEEMSENFRSDMYLTDMVDMDTSVSGMEISVELEWEYSVVGTIKDWAYQLMVNLRDELS